MKKSKLFIENIFIYGFGGIVSKIIPIIMVPIITHMMPSAEYYGIFDMHTTMVSMAAVIAVLGLYDGLFRMYFEKDDLEYRIGTCSTALAFSFLTSLIVSALMFLLRKELAGLFLKNEEYTFLVSIAAFTIIFGASNQIVAAPTRMQNKRFLYLIINFLSPALSYTIAIILLQRGLYITALPVAGLITGIIIEATYYFINRKWFKVKYVNEESLKQMLLIGLPLVPNFLIYWIFNSCDKLMITNILGLGAAGIYSVGSKLGHCSQLIYTAFAGGWSYFAFSTMKDENQVVYNSNLFEVLSVISFCATAFICIFLKTLYKILFPGEYLSGFIVAPYLFLCPLLLMLFQIAASQFTVIKKTWYNTIVLLLGAIINVILNALLIPIMGIEGAAIATLCGYVVSLFICLTVLERKKLFVVSRRLLICVSAIAVYILTWRLLAIDSMIVSVGCFLIFMSFVYLIYKNEIVLFRTKLFKKSR